MKDIVFTQNNGEIYLASVGDDNDIHTSDGAARELGLSKKIIPGMWLASHIQERNVITNINRILFSSNVFYEDIIARDEVLKGSKRDYVFRRGKEVVCSVEGVQVDDYVKVPKPLERVYHTYDTYAPKSRISLFLESLGFAPNLEGTPNTYLASLSAPAMLSFGANNGNDKGIHVSQSFHLHEQYRPGKIKVQIGDERIKRDIRYYELRWIQGERMIASGRAGIVLRGSILEESADLS